MTDLVNNMEIWFEDELVSLAMNWLAANSVFTYTGNERETLGAVSATAMQIENLGMNVQGLAGDLNIYKAIDAALDEWGVDEYDLERKSAREATGTVTINGFNGTVVPVGFLMAKPATATEEEVLFETTQAGTVAGGTVTLATKASVGGTTGNVLANTITEIKSDLSSITSIASNIVFTRGRDRETNARYLKRIMAKVRGIARPTRPGLEWGAISFTKPSATLYEDITTTTTEIKVNEDLTIWNPGKVGTFHIPESGTPRALECEGETAILYTGIDTNTLPHKFTGVTGIAADHKANAEIELYINGEQEILTAYAQEKPDSDIGKVWLYIDHLASGSVHGTLVAAVQDWINGDGTARDRRFRAFNQTVTVIAATRVTVDVTATCVAESGWTTAAAKALAEADVTTRLNDYDAGEDVLEDDVIRTIMDSEGISDITTIVTPTGDTVIQENQVARAGAVTITVT